MKQIIEIIRKYAINETNQAGDSGDVIWDTEFSDVASEICQFYEAELSDFLDFIRWKTESKWEGISLQSEYFEHTNTEIIDEYLKSKQNERLKS